MGTPDPRPALRNLVPLVVSAVSLGLYVAARCHLGATGLVVVAAAQAVVVVPSGVIEVVVAAIHAVEDDVEFPEGAVARRVTGFAERGFIFLVVVTVLFSGAGIRQALNFIAAVVAIKAVYRSPLVGADGSLSEGAVEVYLIGSFLSIGLGTFLTWLLLAPLVPSAPALPDFATAWLPC